GGTRHGGAIGRAPGPVPRARGGWGAKANPRPAPPPPISPPVVNGGGGLVSALPYQIDEQRICYRQYHRADEESGDAEGDQPTNHARKDQQEREVGTVLDQQRAQKVVEGPAEDRPYEEAAPPHGAALRVDPDRCRDQHRPGPHLCDPEDEHQRSQDPHEWHASDREPDPGEAGLDDGRDDDTQGDGSDRLSSEMQHALTPRPHKPPGESVGAACRSLAVRV